MRHVSKVRNENIIIEHESKSPRIDPTAYVAPTATICGDVTIGPNARILFGAAVIAEGGAISIGEACIVMENAVVRSTSRHSTTIGAYCLIGLQAHVVGCSVENCVFIATGASIFHGAVVGQGSEVRINGVVHIRTALPPGTTVPIGWIAVGNPAQCFSPDQHDAIWELQEPLNFPHTVYGIERGAGGVAIMPEITHRLAASLASHEQDTIVEGTI